jgi:lipoprotein-anchoring transpeptidase ErfK/SrfK
MWAPVGREPVPFGDPENPLGTRWLEWRLDGERTSLGFHGTNDAASVGRRVSEGCIRLRNPDVERLYEILPLGAEVRVQP